MRMGVVGDDLTDGGPMGSWTSPGGIPGPAARGSSPGDHDGDGTVPGAGPDAGVGEADAPEDAVRPGMDPKSFIMGSGGPDHP